MTKEELNKEIESFKQLEDNWDNYGGIPPKNKTIKNTYKLLDLLDEEIIDLMYDVYPNPHGTISMDWENDNGELASIEIGIKNMTYFVKFEGEKLIGEDKVKIDNQSVKKFINELKKDD